MSQSEQARELEALIAAADAAINREDWDALMEFYAEQALLVITPGRNVVGKDAIRTAMARIAEHFDHSLHVSQGSLSVLEAGGVALALAETRVQAPRGASGPTDEVRQATYVFRRDAGGRWRCVIDNSYGTGVLAAAPLAG